MSELDGEETEILDAFNEDGLKRSDNFHERVEKHRQFAESVLGKDTVSIAHLFKGRLEGL
jgi:hypothetical protein